MVDVTAKTPGDKMDAATTAKPLRCHRCRSADLALSEVMHEHARYEEGLYLDARGAIRARGEAIFAPGEVQPQLTQIECLNCGHSWRPRRYFAGTEIAATAAGKD